MERDERLTRLLELKGIIDGNDRRAVMAPNDEEYQLHIERLECEAGLAPPPHTAVSTEPTEELDDTAEEPAEKPVEIEVTESAQELAEAEGVDLTDVEGTGADGRIIKADVQKWLDDNE